MIEVERLSKIYGSTYAVRDLDFSVSAGSVVGFLGPNAAGKTTTLRIIAGFLGASAGRVRVGGIDVSEQPLAARRKLGYMPEQCPAYPEMRVQEYLRFRAALKGVPRRKRLERVGRAMELTHIDVRAQSLIGHLSKGYRQRLGLADALVASPELLILDEPTSGLDPNQIREVRQVIADLRQEHTILLSTHILGEVEATCDRAIVIHHGRLAAHGTLQELKSLRRAREVELLMRSPAPKLPDELAAAVDSRVAVGAELERWRIKLSAENIAGDVPTTAPKDIDGWVALLCNRGARVLQVAPVGSSLEDVFAKLTGDES